MRSCAASRAGRASTRKHRSRGRAERVHSTAAATPRHSLVAAREISLVDMPIRQYQAKGTAVCSLLTNMLGVYVFRLPKCMCRMWYLCSRDQNTAIKTTFKHLFVAFLASSVSALLQSRGAYYNCIGFHSHRHGRGVNTRRGGRFANTGLSSYNNLAHIHMRCMYVRGCAGSCFGCFRCCR